MKLYAAAAAVLMVAMTNSAGVQIRSDEEARAVCEPFARYKPGPLEVATSADRREFQPDAFCIDYVYQLVGDEKNYDKARRCCLAAGNCNRELGMIFANGWGVPQNFDAATNFICRAGGEMAPAEQWSMLDRIDG